MSDVIRLLPDSVANQIAAGEVIQRPASVIKELVENAIDAGASNIDVIIRDAGRTLIQVVDDGCGMSDTDARLAFERHATSKIQQAADLFALHTMGFRGEALASIAAVAQVELRTRRKNSDMGTRIIISGSRVECQEPCAMVTGSNMMVKNLFFNVPVRRKFLKKDSVEQANIAREFERLALVNPGVDLSLTANDVTIHRLMRSSLKERIGALFGNTLERQLLPVSTTTSAVTIDGFVGSPETARRRGQLQYLMVNGRHMRHPYFHKAISNCFEPIIGKDLQPNYFLNFTIDPQAIDVNIHPTKNEIKFEDEQTVWQILTAAVRQALGRFNAVPTIDFDPEVPDIPVYAPRAEAPHPVDIDSHYNPFASKHNQPHSSSSTPSLVKTGNTADWDTLMAEFMTPPATSVPSATHQPTSVQSRLFDEPTVDNANGISIATDLTTGQTIQAGNRYILSPSAKGVMIIDQHRAHLTVLYHRLMEQLQRYTPDSQQVMFAEQLHIEPTRADIFARLLPHFEKLGFSITPATEANYWNITATPATLSKKNALDILHDTLNDVWQWGELPDVNEIQHRLALSLSTSTAIRPGQPLSAAECDHLIAQLLSLTEPTYTPQGKRILKVLPNNLLSDFLQ